MALQLMMTDPYGNSYPEGYRRFVFLAVEVTGKTIRAVFHNYRDKAARDAGLNPFGQTEYRVDRRSSPSFDDFMNADNTNPSGIGALVYDFAKAQPDSAGAVDV
jgi:hypothetical protein